LSTRKPWSEQAGGLEAFLNEAAQNFEVVSNIHNWNLTIKKPIAVVVLSQWHHSHADPIWPDGIFKIYLLIFEHNQ
jgi:hypothetical protein